MSLDSGVTTMTSQHGIPIGRPSLSDVTHPQTKSVSRGNEFPTIHATPQTMFKCSGPTFGNTCELHKPSNPIALTNTNTVHAQVSRTMCSVLLTHSQYLISIY